MAKLYKTTITAVILSEEAPVPHGTSLRDISEMIIEGDWSGKITSDGGIEMDPKEAAIALLEQGSDPSFFGLDEHGNQIEEEGP
jgi:hypothetical protein